MYWMETEYKKAWNNGQQKGLQQKRRQKQSQKTGQGKLQKF